MLLLASDNLGATNCLGNFQCYFLIRTLSVLILGLGTFDASPSLGASRCYTFPRELSVLLIDSENLGAATCLENFE